MEDKGSLPCLQKPMYNVVKNYYGNCAGLGFP
jgi:hypothetical protein